MDDFPLKKKRKFYIFPAEESDTREQHQFEITSLSDILILSATSNYLKG
jgi:hypothetical protein